MQDSATALDDFSVEMTAHDLPHLDQMSRSLPAGTRVNITALGTESLEDRLAAARAVAERGLRPMPHLSARRLGSHRELERTLAAHRDQGTSERLFIIGGDPHRPEGPFEDAMSVIASGLLPEHGVTEVGVGGYPEGHPDIDDDALWSALTSKIAVIEGQGMTPQILTQFSFDTDAVLTWIARVRDLGIEAPIRVGVPGPTSVKRLLGFARRCGVSSTAGIARKYGFSLGNLLSTAGPDRFVGDLAAGCDPRSHGDVRIHLFTFGGLTATADWAAGTRIAA